MKMRFWIHLLLVTAAFPKYESPWMPAHMREGADKATEECVYDWSNGKWELQTRMDYAYDSLGRLVRAASDSKARVLWIPEGKYAWDFAYGGDSLLTAFRQRVWTDTGWKDTLQFPVQISHDYGSGKTGKTTVINRWDRRGLFEVERQVSRYNPAGVLIGKEVKKWAGGNWALFERYTVEFDAAGRPLQATSRSFYGGSEKITQTLYQYDGSGRTLSVTQPGFSRNTFSFDGRGNLLSLAQNSWVLEAWRPTLVEDHILDGSGTRIKTVRQTAYPLPSGQMKDLDSMEIHAYEYDSGQGIRKATVSYKIEEAWLPIRQEWEKLDERGNSLMRMESQWQDGRWILTGKYTQVFDAGGHLLGREAFIHDGAEWRLNYRDAHEYNSFHAETFSRSEAWEGGRKISFGEIVTIYDANGNQTERTSRGVTVTGEEVGSRVTHRYWPRTTSIKAAGRAQAGKTGFRLIQQRGKIIVRKAGPDRKTVGKPAYTMQGRLQDP